MKSLRSCLYALLTSTAVAYASIPALRLQQIQGVALEIFSDHSKVPVTLGVMSQCPDAILCESVFDEVIQRTRDKIDLSLTFIGQLNSSEPDFGVTCKHGPSECAGNVIQLCTPRYEDQALWWPFIQCQNTQGRYKVGKPEVVLQCAQQAGIDWANGPAGRCAGTGSSNWGKGEEGIQLLQESVKRTQELGIEKSCTIVIAGKKVCVHDETWKDCEGGHTPDDFVRQIEEEYERRNGKELEECDD